MKYGCRDDPYVMAFSFNEDNYNSNETASRISLNSIHITSPFASTNSDVDGLSNTIALREIINSYVSEDDDVRINLMSYVVNNLYDQHAYFIHCVIAGLVCR